MNGEKGLGEHISDWFRILLRKGVSALLIGLGFVLVLWGGLMFGGSNPAPPGFWSMTLIGAMMILLGVFRSYKSPKGEE